MFELPSAMFLIADGKEFRFARFYIVCEEVPLGTPESPPIVSGVSDMHPSDCPNVEETRNLMQTFDRKKYSHFSLTNIPSAFPHEIRKCVSYNITYHSQSGLCLLRQFFVTKASAGYPITTSTFTSFFPSASAIGIMPPEIPDTSTSLPSTIMEMTPFSTWFGFLTVTW